MHYKGREDQKTVEGNEMDFSIAENEILKEKSLALFEARDLSKPIGAVGTQSRVKGYQEKFDQPDHFSGAPAYHYGSHYSSPAIVLHFLIRVSPYTEGAKAIQNGKFDLADRLFFSIDHAFRNAMEETSDVRELIPEFYSLPEFLLNANKLDFGICQGGERVNNVNLPKWTQDNPFIFVYTLARMLESQTAYIKLKNWIDLVFGYKQNGEEGEKSLNIFYHLTYEDGIDLDSIKEQDRQGVETQIVHFGQTPSKLFNKPHPGPVSYSSGVNRVRSVNITEDTIQVYSKKGERGAVDSTMFTGELNSYNDFVENSIYKVYSGSNKRVITMQGGQMLYYS